MEGLSLWNAHRRLLLLLRSLCPLSLSSSLAEARGGAGGTASFTNELRGWRSSGGVKRAALCGERASHLPAVLTGGDGGSSALTPLLRS